MNVAWQQPASPFYTSHVPRPMSHVPRVPKCLSYARIH